MENFHHKTIKRFSLSGNIHDEANIARLKSEYIRLVKTGMRLSGYVARIDIDPDFTISYNSTTEFFEFDLSIYGVYVGKKKSEWIKEIDGTAVVSTQQNKFSESLQGQELQ